MAAVSPLFSVYNSLCVAMAENQPQGYKTQAHLSRSAQIKTSCVEMIRGKCYRAVIFGDGRVPMPCEVGSAAQKNVHTQTASVLQSRLLEIHAKRML